MIQSIIIGVLIFAIWRQHRQIKVLDRNITSLAKLIASRPINSELTISGARDAARFVLDRHEAEFHKGGK